MWDNSYSAWKRMKSILDNKKFIDFTDDDFNEIGMPLYEIGSVEWYSSYTRGGFSRGYAKNTATRNFFQEARKNHEIQSLTPEYKKINFICDTYKSVVNRFSNIENVLLYCDAPYKNTTKYDISKNFNYSEYYSWIKETSKIFPIFVSEQYLPEEFDKYKIWKKEVKRTNGNDHQFKANETLWLIDNRI